MFFGFDFSVRVQELAAQAERDCSDQFLKIDGNCMEYLNKKTERSPICFCVQRKSERPMW